MGKGVTLVDGDGVSNTITGIEDDAGGTTGSVQRQDGLAEKEDEQSVRYAPSVTLMLGI